MCFFPFGVISPVLAIFSSVFQITTIATDVVRSDNRYVYIGKTYAASVDGSSHFYEVSDLHPGVTYNISVQAGSRGFYGPAAWQPIETEAGNIFSESFF